MKRRKKKTYGDANTVIEHLQQNLDVVFMKNRVRVRIQNCAIQSRRPLKKKMYAIGVDAQDIILLIVMQEHTVKATHWILIANQMTTPIRCSYQRRLLVSLFKATLQVYLLLFFAL